ncbi:transporter suffix domain-containing protein [Peribacillus cavernae]|uniref:Transporter suffix domain-containing protein n=1 Tax=Peribacillus cavernae TaxID=1674310 RepID=A0A3S0W4I8_9BACI|nr:transporter suffix domain-containing protein [Peribacillus cavernae]MDQ0220430.1 hypothetical protein [Peribacillus cavernae]RUQ27554.1 transporter suffix domain-containing protein [Peribacillus cavernae]
MTQFSKKKKNPVIYKIGIYLIIISFLLWLVPVIVPFLSITATVKVTLVTGALITAEILFWIGVAIVGKEVASKYRSYLNPRNWKKKKEDQNIEDKNQ